MELLLDDARQMASGHLIHQRVSVRTNWIPCASYRKLLVTVFVLVGVGVCILQGRDVFKQSSAVSHLNLGGCGNTTCPLQPNFELRTAFCITNS